MNERALFLLEQLGQPGASVALMKAGQPVFGMAYGLASATCLEARFPVYSVTKLLIAAATLTLVQENRLDLDMPLDLPGLPFPLPMTVRQTLNHTGGLPDYGDLPAYTRDLQADPRHPWSDAQFLERTLSSGLLSPPGRQFAYSNIGYLLLRLLLERLTGQTLGALLHQRLFAPLGLTRTATVADLTDTLALTPGYSRLWTGNGAEGDIRSRYHPGWVGHGLVASTAPELTKLTQAIFEGAFFGPELLAQMLSPVPVSAEHPVFRRPAYGLGTMLGRSEATDSGLSSSGLSSSGLGGLELAGHGGGGPGYSAGVLHWPDLNLTCTALIDHDLPEAGLMLAYQLGLAFTGRESPPARP